MKSSQITSSDDIKQLGTILCVWAHPDDESFCCAGTMAAAITNGQTTICVTATRGEAGVQNEARWPAARLGEIREAEMKEALHCLGCSNHHWLGYADGGCEKISDDEGAGRILEFINQYQPDTILTFGPDGFTGHPDHQAVSRWSLLAAQRANYPIAVYYVVELDEVYKKIRPADEKLNIFFNIDKPPIVAPGTCDILFHLPQAILDKKYQALRAMPSQTEAMFDQLDKDLLDSMVNTESFVLAK